MDGDKQHYDAPDGSAQSNPYRTPGLFATTYSPLSETGSYGAPLYPLGPLESPPLETSPATTYPGFPLDPYPTPLAQSAWPSSSTELTPFSDASSWIDGGASATGGGFASSADMASFDYQHEADYYDANSDIASLPYGAAMASGTSTALWGAAAPDSLFTPPTLPSTAPSQSTSSADPHPDKVKRKRGRPRLYDDDGVPRPRTKPGRPPTRSLDPESSISLSSPSLTTTDLVLSAAIAGPSTPASRTRRTSFREDKESTEDANPDRSEAVRARNKAAAARYRAKTQNAIAAMEAEEHQVSMRRRALLATAGRLRDEVFELKNEVLRHADCGCPLITGYLSDAARRVFNSMDERNGSISSEGETIRVEHVIECLHGGNDGGGWAGLYLDEFAEEDGELDGG